MLSLLGIALLPCLALALSVNRTAVNLRTVAGAFGLQALMGALVLWFEPGKEALAGLARGVSHVLTYSQEGVNFLFGNLGNQSLGFVFALNVLPVIVFFSALVAVLYHLQVMPLVVKLLGGALQRLLGTSRPESLSAAANVFVGQAEAPLVVKPFVPRMTRSELFAVMVGGLASIAGSVLAGYAAMGVQLEFLLAACFMAAPGGLMMAKIVMPEVEQPHNSLDAATAEEVDELRYVNIFDAAASGALAGMQIALAVGAMLLAFIALIAMLNGIIGWAGSAAGFDHLTLELILGWLLQPLAWTLGVPWAEAQQAGSFIGQKLILNEFVAYLGFIEVQASLSTQTQAIVTFALCGFANFSSIAILLGGLGAMAPGRRKDIARMGLRALLAATLANLMSAALAGFFLALGS